MIYIYIVIYSKELKRVGFRFFKKCPKFGSLSGKMKLFLTVSGLVKGSKDADLDVSIPESCIIAPADGQKLQSTNWGPIWKK